MSQVKTKRKRNRTRQPKQSGSPVFLYTSFGKNQHKPPVIKEVNNKDYIPFGKKNDYPMYLLDLFNMSGRHNAIITGKVDRIMGKGWGFDIEGVPADQIGRIRNLMNHANRGESLNDFTRKIVLDEEIFYGLAIEIIYNMAGELSEMIQMDFSKVRKGKEGTEFEGKFLFSDDWQTSNPEFMVLEPYDPTNPVGKQLLYWQGYRPDTPIYPLPEYIGSTAAIETDIEISNWHLNNIKHGFSGGYIINFNNGIPTDEEQKAIEKKIIDKHTGSDAAGRFVLNFSDGKDRSAEVIPITPNNLDKQFEQLTQSASQEIFTGHKVTSPMMFGVKTAGQLGGRTEIMEAEELFENTYTRHKRMIIERIVNQIFIDNGMLGVLSLQPAQTLSFQFSEMTIASVMTTEELRLSAEGMGIELIDEPEETTPTPMKKVEMSAEEEDEVLLAELAKVGRPAEDYITLKAMPILHGFRNERQMHLSEIQLVKAYFAPALDISITTLDRKILDLIVADEHISVSQISDVVGVGETEVANIIERLERGGALRTESVNDVEGEPQIKRTVTPEARGDIEQLPETVAEIEVMYRYVERPGVPAAISGSRNFCVRLLAMNRIFSREDIERLSASEGRNVWQRRGGFYHNPETDITTPYCRHIWQQEIVTTRR